jgi:hypothetical protein
MLRYSGYTVFRHKVLSQCSLYRFESPRGLSLRAEVCGRPRVRFRAPKTDGFPEWKRALRAVVSANLAGGEHQEPVLTKT